MWWNIIVMFKLIVDVFLLLKKGCAQESLQESFLSYVEGQDRRPKWFILVL